MLHSQLPRSNARLERGKDQTDAGGGGRQDPTEAKKVGSMANGLTRRAVLVGDIRQLQSNLGLRGFCTQVEYRQSAHVDRVESPPSAGSQEVGDSQALRARHAGKLGHARGDGVGQVDGTKGPWGVPTPSEDARPCPRQRIALTGYMPIGRATPWSRAEIVDPLYEFFVERGSHITTPSAIASMRPRTSL